MKEAFEQELGRERLKLEAYKKIQQGGFLPSEDEVDDGATLVGGPSFEHGDDVDRPGAHGFGEEGPTEIYGEVGTDDVQISSSGDGVSNAGDLAETGRRP